MATNAIPCDPPPITQPKKRKSIKSPAVQNAIIVKAAQGLSNTQIANDLNIHRATVSNVLSINEISQHIAECRSDMVLAGDVRQSVQVIRKKLAKESESAALAILRGFNVLQSGNQMTVNVQNNGAMTWLQVQAQEKDEQSLDNQPQTTTNSDATLPK